ncbi:MAG: hypothetical protein D8M57_01705 [Candidatus Scalindua sp. AMX11]|nr:MAG: hypothetical protein DWQ00_15690 [Candidatus Scalindua sp.]RZV69313.1 MAG: hypothetical protein EX341_16120 [Candidatus Scalindua sp. SCAELEC01]TDE66774.1 MAG: hypothetical protein D8M57_01705 [Candidatus Scalindua sp. AMX11]
MKSGSENRKPIRDGYTVTYRFIRLFMPLAISKFVYTEKILPFLVELQFTYDMSALLSFQRFYHYYKVILPCASYRYSHSFVTSTRISPLGPRKE